MIQALNSIGNQTFKAVEAEILFGKLTGARREASELRRVAGKTMEPLGPSLHRRIERQEKAGLSFEHQIANGADVGGHAGETGGEGFRQHLGHVILAGWEYENVAGLIDLQKLLTILAAQPFHARRKRPAGQGGIVGGNGQRASTDQVLGVKTQQEIAALPGKIVPGEEQPEGRRTGAGGRPPALQILRRQGHKASLGADVVIALERVRAIGAQRKKDVKSARRGCEFTVMGMVRQPAPPAADTAPAELAVDGCRNGIQQSGRGQLARQPLECHHEFPGVHQQDVETGTLYRAGFLARYELYVPRIGDTGPPGGWVFW